MNWLYIIFLLLQVETKSRQVRQLRAQMEEAEESSATLQAQMSKLRATSRKATAKVYT